MSLNKPRKVRQRNGKETEIKCKSTGIRNGDDDDDDDNNSNHYHHHY